MMFRCVVVSDDANQFNRLAAIPLSSALGQLLVMNTFSSYLTTNPPSVALKRFYFDIDRLRRRIFLE